MPVDWNNHQGNEESDSQASQHDLGIGIEIVEKALHVSSCGRRVRNSVQKLYNKVDSETYKNLRYVQKS